MCQSWARARTRPGCARLVFDGARAFEGVTPDLDLHCARVNDSAAETVPEADGLPKQWVQAGARRHQPDSTRMPRCTSGRCIGRKEKGRGCRRTIRSRRAGVFRSTKRRCARRKDSPLRCRPIRRPTLDTMPVDAKAGCLYPNNARSLFEAHARGFDNAIVCDMLGQRSGTRHLEHFHGEGRSRIYASHERNISGGHYAAASDRTAAQRRRQSGREDPHLSGL